MSKQTLVAILREEIARSGPIPFVRFMAQALYHPDHGYYTGGDAQIGPRGDYYTSPSVHAVFGELIARQLLQMVAVLGPADDFVTLVEMGAGRGVLCRDILHRVRQVSPAAFSRLQYVIVEKSPRLMQRQQAALSDLPVRWADHIPIGVTGVVLSNELIDAFPVHRLRMEAGRLQEMWVDWREDGFQPVWMAPSSPKLAPHLRQLDVPFDRPMELEVNLQALDWMRAVAAALTRGFVLTIDYGYPAAGLYGGRRRRGTFLCYDRHTVNEAPFERIGMQDMTAHVDFTSLARAGEEAGLSLLGFTDQTHFLMGLGIAQRMEEAAAGMETSPEARRTFLAMRQLMAPGGMGSVFKVLIQGKGVPSDLALEGLKFRSFFDLL